MELFQKGLDSNVATYQYKELKIKAGDNLQVNVFTQASNNQEQTAVINMGGVGKSSGLYSVNNLGQIEFPKIGLVTAEGMTVRELKALLQSKWSPFVKDLLVNVQLQNITVNFLGEFNSPGAKIFTTEKITLIDAIAAAGGLNDDGKRNDILVIREEQGQRKIYKVDLRDAAFYNSPVYQLQQNDLVYAGIGDSKFRQRGFQEFTQKTAPILTFVSFFNFALGIAILITTLSK
ncbi:MAG: wza [Chitinophagaceae bacterium]|nr:MAG: wza [Chitinophagaceae bacterium]